jgi:tricarballylate dehydrogenase
MAALSPPTCKAASASPRAAACWRLAVSSPTANGCAGLGPERAGDWPADNFLIRGTRFNQGVLLKFMEQAGADMVGDPSQSHCVAIDARAPLYDGGICTRDCVSLGIMLNRNAERFYDEGEDFWPKRYAIWGRLVAQQPEQIGYSIIDSKAIGRFMPPVFPGNKADTLPELARQLGLDEARFVDTIQRYNAACQAGQFDHTVLDNCHTEGLTPAKSHWALPLDTPPYYGYALRPGITFTYLGLKTNADAAVHFAGQPSPNLFVAGEMMAGNVLGKGYVAGIGMAIGTAFGRIAGSRAAQAASKESDMQQLTRLIDEAQQLAAGQPASLLNSAEAEVARDLQICNACRYCEGFCAVFPP